MKTLSTLSTALVLVAVTSAPAFAQRSKCSVSHLAGQWVFATGIGHQNVGAPLPPDKDITAIGTMNIDRDGNIEGIFDATVQDAFPLPDNTYHGTLVLDRGCLGTLTFITSAGSYRMDSIAVVSRSELLGMSLDPLNLWTYQVRKIGAPDRRAEREPRQPRDPRNEREPKAPRDAE